MASIAALPSTMTLALLILAAAPLQAAPPDGPPRLHADLILRSGKVWTVAPDRPEVEAVAIRAGRIAAVGSNADLAALIGKHTRLIELQGRRVLPGFHDSHVHLLGSGLRLGEVALKDARDEADFGKRLRDFDHRLPRDRWLLGGEWDHDRTFAGRLPTAELIDRYVPDRPVFLRRYDGHMAIVNTRVLRLAGINADTPDPPGGVIYRQAGSRQPSGVLRDNAMDLVARLVPPPSDAEMVEAVRAALKEARQVGVTSMEDMDGSDADTRRRLVRLYQRLARQGQLTSRVALYWPLADWESLARLGIEAGFGDDWVKLGGVKGFVDGSLGSSTARMFNPYLHEQNNRGVYVTPPAQLRRLIDGADRAGLRIAIHAIGDQANAELLDAFAETARKNGPRDRRFRIEHAQHLRPADIPRFAQLGVIASMQPYHAIDDGRWAESRIGLERCVTSYTWHGLLKAHARLAFGSDWSVAPLSPLLGIDAAVNRRTLDGKHPEGWIPGERIPVEQAIEAYTRTSAYAAGVEASRGSVEVGKLADLVVLSRDVLVPAERDHIVKTKVDLTIVGGRVVFERGP